MYRLPKITLILVLSLVGLAAAAPAFAQSDALKQAWHQTDTLLAAGKYAEAEPWAKKAIDLAQTESGADSTNYAISLNNLAVLYWNQGRYVEAEPLYKRALAIREKALGPDHPDVALSLNSLAILYDNQGHYAEAEPLIKRALAIREKALGPEHPDVAQSLNSLGGLYEDQGRYTEAEPLYKRALTIREKVLGPDHPDVAESLNNLADLYDAQGRYAEAEPLYKRALAIHEKALGHDHPAVATSLNNLAGLYVEQGRYADAEPLYKRALAIREKALGPEHPDVAMNLTNLAALYDTQGRYAEAEPLFKRAWAIREKALGPDHPDVAQSLNSLGAVYDYQGRYADAEPLIKRALAIYEKALGPDHPEVARSLNNLAKLYNDQRRYTEAEPLFKRALEIEEKTLGPEHPDFARSLSNLAKLYDDQGRYAESLPLYQRALAIKEKTLGPEHPLVALSLNNLAELYRDQNRYAEAEPLYKRAVAIDEKALGRNHPDVAQILTNLAGFYYVQGRYAEALPFTRRAAAITAGRAAGAEEQNKGGQSELHSRRNIFLAVAAVTAHLIAANDPRSPQLREEGFEALQWSKASDTAAAVSHMAARFSAGSDALAKLVRERQDSQDQLDADDAAILKTVSQPPAQRNAKAEAALRTDEDGLHQKLNQLDAQMPPRYAELVNPKPITIAETQKLLAPDQALIVFAAIPKESFVAVVTHSSYQSYISPVGARDLSAAVKQLRSSLDPDRFGPHYRKWSLAWFWDRMKQLVGIYPAPVIPPFEASTSYTLYQQLLAPAEPMLKGMTQLYVVTDGALESLPLGVLLTQKPVSDQLSGSDLIDAPWLVRRYAISVLPSVSSLKALRLFAKNLHATKPFMGIGNPVLKDQPGGPRGAPVQAQGVELRSVYRGAGVDQAALRDLPSLPETADELQAEAEFLKAGPDSLLLGQAATVTAVLHTDLSSRRVIAFATHGLLAGDVGVAEPGLVLTPPGNMTPPQEPTEEDDGVLKASQIALLNLNADLVILSACNTAGPDGTPGAEGFSGLAKAFLYAGARTLVVSNWSVESTSTTALMKNMQIETAAGVGHAEALRQAELALMNNPVYAHPLFWAPFVVVGEGVAGKE